MKWKTEEKNTKNKYYKHKYESSKQALNRCINTIDPKEIPDGMTVQDYIDLILDPDIDGTEHWIMLEN